ncbi:MAG: ThiF family adenylyltransferase [Candidatus Helarchaeota archaeon]|nr:ThiF family adenylyltransferase [Candidatus Helarchaeota archaeon]
MGKRIMNSDRKNENQVEIDLERYNRQMLLKEWNQEKILDSTIFIAGVGALGTIVSLNLAMMGVGHLILCDYDTIELSNLARQVLFENKDIGKSKVLIAKEALERINPTIQIDALNKKLQTIDRKIFEQCDVVVDCLDRFETRRWLNSLCVTLKKPLVHGGMFGWMGNVQVVIPFETPCLECHPLIPQERLQKPCTPPGEERKELEKEEPEEKIPTLATVSTVIAGIQSQEVIKILLDSKVLDEYLFYDGLSEALTKVGLIKNPNCIICGKYRLKGVDFAIDNEDTIRDIKNRVIMSWGLQEPIRIVIKGIIRQDDVKIQDIKLKEKEAIFVWDKIISEPLKLYAILKGKELIPAVTLIPKKEKIKKISDWSQMQEDIVDKGRVTYHKNLLKIQALDSGQDIQFFKTYQISKTQRKIRYKLKQS